MNVFGNHARYYDPLYRDKDYPAEAHFVHDLIQKHMPGACMLLELRCGTGAHAIALADQGYQVHGVDITGEMLELAEARGGRLMGAVREERDLTTA